MTNIKTNHAAAGIVIVAQSFNPSIFSETWLINNKVVELECLIGTRIFDPAVVTFQINDKETVVGIDQQKLQISFKTLGIEGDFDRQLNVPIRVVELLHHIPYQAMGINFDFWMELAEGEDFLKYNRSLLGEGEYKLLKEFAAPDARFGKYLSRDYKGARLKLSIIPTIKPAKGSESSLDLLQFSFNYHFEVSSIPMEDRSIKLLAYMREWQLIKSYSEKLVELGANL